MKDGQITKDKERPKRSPKKGRERPKKTITKYSVGSKYDL